MWALKGGTGALKGGTWGAQGDMWGARVTCGALKGGTGALTSDQLERDLELPANSAEPVDHLGV